MPSAFGKVILLGEHAVVFSHPALAAALDQTVCASAERGSGATSVSVPAWALTATTLDSSPPGRALARIASAFDAMQGLALRCETDLPPGAGLGSSAALAVAITRAIAGATGREPSLGEIERIANDAEQIFHASPSGVDVALAARGGAGLFERGKGLTPLSFPAFELIIALSDEPRSTGSMVGGVGERRRQSPAVHEAVERLGQLAVPGAHALCNGDLATLGKLMNCAHEDLSRIGVSTSGLDKLIELGLSAGALGAKLTGAGGGGAVLVLAPGNESELKARYEKAGYRVLRARLGGPA